MEEYSIFGIWTWWIIGGLLLVVELLLPGVFFIWLGLAACTVGLVDLFAHLPWQAEVALFVATSVAYVVLGHPWLKRRQAVESDRPFLNRRQYEFVGKSYVLQEPITQRRGRLRIEDTLWEVEGPDAPRGSWVRVTSVDGLKLKVEPTQEPA